MNTKFQIAGIMLIISMASSATAAMNPIQNPASNIYNPATRMENPDPLTPPSPVTPPEPIVQKVPVTPEPVVQAQTPQPQVKPVIPLKNYNFKTSRAYINAAKKAYAKNDNPEFLSITEDALRRINAGTLKASEKTRQTLLKYKNLGYRILNNGKK